MSKLMPQRMVRVAKSSDARVSLRARGQKHLEALLFDELDKGVCFGVLVGNVGLHSGWCRLKSPSTSCSPPAHASRLSLRAGLKVV